MDSNRLQSPIVYLGGLDYVTGLGLDFKLNCESLDLQSNAHDLSGLTGYKQVLSKIDLMDF